MIESAIARRYAKALFELGKENQKTGPYLADLEEFNRACAENPCLLDALANRFADRSARLRVVDDVLKKITSDAVVGYFLKTLVKKGRIELIALVTEAYRHYVYELENKVEATITSARPLDESFFKSVEKIFSEITKKTVVARQIVNPDVLGGLAVRLGGKIYDGTVQGDLNRLSFEMRKTALM